MWLTDQKGTPIGVGSTNKANSSATATIAGLTERTAYATGLLLISSGATAAGVVLVTITGLSGGTLTFPYVVQAGATLQNTNLDIIFPQPLPASGKNVSIVATCPALGAGSTNCTITLYGFYGLQ